MIYLDNAATTMKKPECVRQAVYEAMGNMGNSGRGSHRASLDASRIIYEAREHLAKFFHVGDAAGVVFTANATESLNIAIKGLFQNKDHVITTQLEHNSVLRPLYELEEKGIELTILKADRQGNISYEEMENSIKENTRGIVCTHASNVTGNMTDIKKIGEICREHGILFVLDASQTAGVFPIDMKAQNIDVLCFTGHKGMMGPQGTGGICVRKGVKIRPLLSGGSGVHSFDKQHPAVMPTALEAGTLNGHGIAGLLAAVKYIEETGMERIQEKERRLAMQFYEAVREIPGITVYGDFQEQRAAVVSLNIGDYDSAYISDILADEYEIYTRPGAHCAPLMHEALGTKEQGVVRFSFSWFNEKTEVLEVVKVLRELAEE